MHIKTCHENCMAFVTKKEERNETFNLKLRNKSLKSMEMAVLLDISVLFIIIPDEHLDKNEQFVSV